MRSGAYFLILLMFCEITRGALPTLRFGSDELAQIWNAPAEHLNEFGPVELPKVAYKFEVVDGCNHDLVTVLLKTSTSLHSSLRQLGNKCIKYEKTATNFLIPRRSDLPAEFYELVRERLSPNRIDEIWFGSDSSLSGGLLILGLTFIKHGKEFDTDLLSTLVPFLKEQIDREDIVIATAIPDAVLVRAASAGAIYTPIARFVGASAIRPCPTAAGLGVLTSLWLGASFCFQQNNAPYISYFFAATSLVSLYLALANWHSARVNKSMRYKIGPVAEIARNCVTYLTIQSLSESKAHEPFQ